MVTVQTRRVRHGLSMYALDISLRITFDYFSFNFSMKFHCKQNYLPVIKTDYISTMFPGTTVGGRENHQ